MKRSLLVAALLLLSTPAVAGWMPGAWVTQQHPDCLTLQMTSFSLSRSTYWSWEDGPKVGQVFYVASTYYVGGNACRGGADIAPEFALPDGVVLAVSEENPVRCFYENVGKTPMAEVPSAACPQVPTPGQYGPVFTPDTATGLFPVAMGVAFQIWVPVLAKKPLYGTQFSTPIWAVADYPMWAFPSVAVSVAPNPPLVGYPPIAATEIGETSVRLKAFVENHFTQGTAFIELGLTEQAFDLATKTVAIGDVDSVAIETRFEGLEPGMPYFWRVRFVSSLGAAVVGDSQQFTTTGARRYPVTVTATAGGAANVAPSGALQPEGTELYLTAEPHSGHRFEGWFSSGTFFSAEPVTTWTVDGATQLEARFALASPTQSGGGSGGAGSPVGPVSEPVGGVEDPEPAQGCSATGSGSLPLMSALVLLLAFLRRTSA